MNLKERATMVKAMETIVRSINDEDIFYSWLLYGVADGDIDEKTTDEELDFYCEDETFSELMELFLILMAKAKKSGGLYTDNILSKNAK